MKIIKINDYIEHGNVVLNNLIIPTLTNKNEVLSGIITTTTSAPTTTSVPTTSTPTTISPSTTPIPRIEENKIAYCADLVLPVQNCIISDRMRLKSGVLE